MTRTILVPVDGSQHSREALRVAATEFVDAELIVFHAIEPYDVASVSEPAVWDDRLLEKRRDDAEQLLEEYRDLASEYDVDVQTELAHGSPSHAIVEAAGEFDVDHIVMGSRGRTGVGRVVLGSVAETVAERSPVSVSIIRPGD